MLQHLPGGQAAISQVGQLDIGWVAYFQREPFASQGFKTRHVNVVPYSNFSLVY